MSMRVVTSSGCPGRLVEGEDPGLWDQKGGRRGWQDKSAAVSGGANGCEESRNSAVAQAGLPSGAAISRMFSMQQALAAASKRLT